MNKTELVEAVASEAGLSKPEAEKAVNAVTGTITSQVRSGEDVRIIGFGSFRLRSRAARKGRNPQTGASVSIKASKSMAFTPGATLKRELNSRAPAARAKKSAAPAKASASKAPAKAAPAKASKAPAKASKAPAKAAPAKTAAKKATKAPAKATKSAAKKR